MADETTLEMNERFMAMLYQEQALSKVVFILLACVALGLLAVTLVRRYKREWDCNYYLLLCAAVAAWAVCSTLAVFGETPGDAGFWNTLRNVGVILIPPFLYLHIRQQVSYKEQRIAPALALFIVPGVLIYTVLGGLSSGDFRFLPIGNEAQWLYLAFCVYALVVLVKSYLLCFNVFYQMPLRMRESTRSLLAGVTSVSVLLFLDALWNSSLAGVVPRSAALDILLPLAAPVAFLVLICPAYGALRLTPAANVIVTSREFVMGALSTTILVLSRKMNILDWNRKDWGKGFPLPKPLYREPIEVYRERALEQSGGRVSPHNENVINTVSGGEETHFFMQTHEIGNKKKLFGYLVEITEITPIYSTLRYFEEIAHYDQLTRLYNRNAYLGRISAATREENLPLLILVGDANNLKLVNDTHGHLLGDTLLTTVADIIRRAAPPDAFVARVGGDEFVLLAANGSAELAERFIRDVNTLCGQAKQEVIGTPSISWGYALMTSASQDYNDVFAVADEMMYRHKKARHQFSSSGVLPPMNPGRWQPHTAQVGPEQPKPERPKPGQPKPGRPAERPKQAKPVAMSRSERHRK